MTRRCSHCSNDGHNLRTCPNKGVKVFGVRFDLDQTVPMRKSASMGNLSQHVESGGAAAEVSNGYASDGFDHGSSSRERKKGMIWTKEEHRQFLLGLEVLGKGDWRGIARSYVPSRTSTQVASHAQKYFNRLNHQSCLRRRRSSVFDMTPEVLGDARTFTIHNQEPESEANVSIPPPPPPPQPLETKHKTISSIVPNPSAISNSSAPSYLLYHAPYFPPYPYIGSTDTELPAPLLPPMPMRINNASYIVKPTAVHCTPSTNLRELADMSKLNLFEKCNDSSSSAPVNIVGNSNSRSAFHGSNSTQAGSPINLSSSPIHAV